MWFLLVYTLFRAQLPCSMYLREVKDNIYKACHYFPWVGSIHLTGNGPNEYQNPLDLESYKFQFPSFFSFHSVSSILHLLVYL